MKRRDFLIRAVPAGTVPFLIGGLSLRAYARSPLLDTLLDPALETDRVLVLIQLNGGNDGLNTVIPRDQYSALSNARANIMLDENKVLPLTAATGLHPAMTGLQAMYNDGRLAVVQSVSYPNPNFSHFRATDIWLTGADYNQILATGWMGRYLNEEFPNYPQGYPTTAMPDPLAIQVGSVVSTGLQGPTVTMGIAVTDPNSIYTLPGGSDTPPDTPAGHELVFIRQVAQQTQLYGNAIRTAAGKASNKSTLYPPARQNSLADQLKIVAQLVAGGLKTRMYVVNLGGFDTHSGQVNATGGTDTGTHATLLGRLSVAISAFQDDLRLLGVEDRVVGMTFSEFGRRIKSNASLGTDHGVAAPMFLFGKHINAAVVGANPTLPPSASVNDNIAMLFDFRRVYGSILKDWFGASSSELQRVLYTPGFTSLQTLGLIHPSAVLSVDDTRSLPKEFALHQNFPNPFNPTTVITFDLPRGEFVRLEVFNLAGQRVATLIEGDQAAGTHEVTFNADGLASGVYLYRLHAGDYTQTRKLMLVK